MVHGCMGGGGGGGGACGRYPGLLVIDKPVMRDSEA